MSIPFRKGDLEVVDGKPYYATLPEDFETCCDCGLTHRVRYRIEDSNGDPIKGAQIKMTVWRDETQTKIRRELPAGMIGRPGFLVDIVAVKRLRHRKK